MPLPNYPDFLNWTWADLAPHYAELADRPLTAATVEAWLADWTALTERVSELRERLYVATTANTADATAEARFNGYLETIFPPMQVAENQLKAKLLTSGLCPAGFEVPLHRLKAEADLFRPANVPLLAEESKHALTYGRITGAQTITWHEREYTLPETLGLLPKLARADRETLWRQTTARQHADYATLSETWRTLYDLRQRIAHQAGHTDFRAYQWQALFRFDYTPADCEAFHQAIETVVVPAATRIYQRHAARLGLSRLRPWDLSDGWYGIPVPPPSQAPLQPFQQASELEAIGAAMFHQVDSTLGAYFETMRRENLLDLPNRPHKAPSGYCTAFAHSRRPFIFMNAVGTHDDVQTLLHEGGHAFHVFESANLPYNQQHYVGSEFCEVASMAMELLAAPYLDHAHGGPYAPAEAARARAEHLEMMVLFWPFMAVVDAFQHWAYTHPHLATHPAECEARWLALWQRFMPWVDWHGLEAECAAGWQRKMHIFEVPFYYVEYGLAQLGATQVWRNALHDQAASVRAYRQALALGGTVTLPQLFATAGARFAFDAGTLHEAITFIEHTLDALYQE